MSFYLVNVVLISLVYKSKDQISVCVCVYFYFAIASYKMNVVTENKLVEYLCFMYFIMSVCVY